MTQQEFSKFMETTYAYFPSLREWLFERSPNVEMTLNSWRRTLEKITYNQAVAVLDGWIDGTVHSPPIGYKRDLFALDVRAIVHRKLDEALRVASREETFRKALTGRYGYKQPKAIVALSPYFNRMFDIGERLRLGELTHEEAESRVELIVAEGCEAIEAEDRAKSYR